MDRRNRAINISPASEWESFDNKEGRVIRKLSGGRGGGECYHWSYERTCQGNDLKICDAFPVFFKDKSSAHNNKTERETEKHFSCQVSVRLTFHRDAQILANFKQLPDGQTLRFSQPRFAQSIVNCLVNVLTAPLLTQTDVFLFIK